MIWVQSLKSRFHRFSATSWRGLIIQLFLITVLPLAVLVVAFTFGSLVLHQRAMRSLVGERDRLAVRTAASALSAQIHHRANAIRLLSAIARDSNSDELTDLLATADFLQSDLDYGLALFSADGTLEALTGDRSFWENMISQLTPAMLSLSGSGRDGTDVMFLESANHPQTGERLMFILIRDADRRRIAVGAFSAAALAQQTLYSASEGHTTSFLLMDRNREAIYRMGFLFTEGELRNHAGITEALGGESGATYRRVGASEHVVAYSPVEPLGWALVSEEPWERVDTPVLRVTQAAPLVLAPVLILALIALWFAARQIIRPLQDLEAQSAELAKGNFRAIDASVGGIAEIRRLQMGLAEMAHKLEAAQRSLHDYIGLITAAQEDERRRLARELHDETVQSLVVLKQRLQLTRLASQNDRAAISLREIEDLTEQTIEELRRLTRALRPIYLEDFGLVTALKMLAYEAGQIAGIPVEFQLQGVERRLDTAAELALYRLAQEALNNVARHAQASRAVLCIQFSPQSLTLQVSDDGKGFHVPKRPSEFASGGHMGLLGLYERSEMIGAQLEIVSAPGKGAQINIVLPLSPIAG